MNKISTLIFGAILLFSFNSLDAACGSCSGDVKVINKMPIKKSPVNNLVMYVPKDGKIEGIVITSCGQCNFGTRDKGCSLSVKIGEKIYPVKGTGIHDHGDAHGSDGFCRAVRVAWASGKMKKDVFHADSFVLVGDSK